MSSTSTCCGRKTPKPIRVEGRDPRREAARLPLGTFGFYYFDRWEGTVDDDGESIAVESEQLRRSKSHFVGKLLDRDALAALPVDAVGCNTRRLLLGRMDHADVKMYVLVPDPVGRFCEFDPAQHEHVEAPA